MTYSQPAELGEALAILQQGGPKIIAGGTDVYPALTRGVTHAAYLDTTRIHGFRDITRTDTEIRLGGAVTWSGLIAAELPPVFDALKEAAREVGSLQIQNAGTLAGNICNASPAADGVPALLALDASVEMCSSARGTRVIPLQAFITGVRKTALAPDELVTAIIVPNAPKGMGAAFEKLGSRRYMVISITMTAANILIGPDGRISEARIAVGSCSAVAQRLSRLEADLIGTTPNRMVVKDAHLNPLAPINDVRGTGVYRLEAVRHQIKRAVARAGQP